MWLHRVLTSVSSAGLPVASVAIGMMILSAAPAIAVPTTLDLPPRQPGAMTGSQFHTYIAGMTTAQREAAVYAEIAAGNIPPFMRNLKPVPVSTPGHAGTIYVTADYVGIGSDADYYRMPMSLTLAYQVANLCNAQLPTPKMVDHIRDAATIRIAPVTETPDATMNTEPIFWKHNERVDAQLTAFSQGGLIAGDKKDVVSAAILLADNANNFARVAIYGWPYTNNSNIQPLYTGHEEAYHDYSHGIRLVSQFMIYDGQETTVSAVLNDPARILIFNNAIDSPDNSIVYYPSRADNGCFEGTVQGNGVGRAWTPWTAAGSAAISFGRASVNKNDGDFSQFWNRGDTAAMSGGVYQRISVLPGYQYTVRAAMKRQAGYDDNLVAFGYDVNGGTNPASASIVWTNLTGAADNTWYGMQTSFTATGGFVTLFGKGGHASALGDNDAYYYLDSVALFISSASPASATPTPSISPTATPVPTATPTVVPTATPSATTTPTPSISPTASPAPTATPNAHVGFKTF
ncbi:hypothetical protein IT570_09050 [Candidatus Sumerlaeota bacterium]|nr:hypothetical protein [Candidatus Sumerlaeota bacterium]